MKTLSKQSLERLADAHIARFERMLDSESPAIRHTECQHYLTIWNEVRRCESFEQLSEPGRCEVEDAWYDGGYNRLLLPEECHSVQDEEV